MGKVVRRPVKPIDGEMLRALFAESRDDLAALPVDVRDVLLDLQYRAQHRSCLQNYPNARREILLLDDEPIGYLVLDDSDDSDDSNNSDSGGSTIRVVEICVTTRERGHGVDVLVLEDLIASAAERPVRLSVRHADTTARGRFERLGFVSCAHAPGNEGYLEMEHPAQQTARAVS
jgi:ribosomal protein S18 acetylase RimI-like enzyme